MAVSKRSFLIPVLSVLFGAAMVAYSLAAPDDAPATSPATTQSAQATTKPADVTAAAQPLLEKLSAAYRDLKSLDVVATMSGEFDVDGQKESQKIDITGSYAAPQQFRHAVRDELLVGSTGEQFYLFEQASKLYRTSEAKKEKVALSELPEPFGRILLDQNLSLALALSKDPSAELKGMFEKIDKAADVTIDGKAHPALVLTSELETVTVALDPQTSLVRRATVDVTNAIKKRGAQDVAKAQLTLDYSASKPGATTKRDQFAWAPPAGARDVATIPTAGEVEMPALALVGKPAPDFVLKDVNDKDVSFAKDLKGSVLVFDFWATWCPPCVEAMPHLNALAGEFKDKGVKVVTINAADEDKDLVQGFMNSRKLGNLMVLLDPGSKVSGEYKGNELLPTTMVIGKDGTIRKVITTLGSEGERDLKAAVEEALNASR